MSLCLLQGIFPNFSALLFLTSQCLELERLSKPVLNQQGIGLFKFICGLELIALRFRSFDILAPADTHSAVLISTDKQSIEQAASQSFQTLHKGHMAQNYGSYADIQTALTVVNAAVCYQIPA